MGDRLPALRVILLAALSLAGCSEPFVGITAGPNPHNPLAWIVEVTALHDGPVRVEYGTADRWDHRTPAVEAVAWESTPIQVLGLRADTEYQLRAAEVDRGETSRTLRVRTDGPDPEWPQCEATGIAGDPDEVFCTQYRLDDWIRGGFFCADRSGEPVWFLHHPDKLRLQALRRLRDGGFVAVGDGSSKVVYFDRWGALVAEYGPLWFDGRTRFEHQWIDGHEVIELTEGRWAGAVAFLTATEDQRSSGISVQGQGIVVYDRAADEVRWDWLSHGVLGDDVPIDPALEEDYSGNHWMHGNAIVHVVRDDGREEFWLSARDMDWIIAIDVDTDAVRWRLGRGGDFTLVDDLDAADPLPLRDDAWFSYQHAPEILEQAGERTRLLLFDNETDEGDSSRVVGLEFDEGTRLASPFFEYGDEDPASPENFFSSIGGDVDVLPGGDALLVADAYDEPALFELAFPEGEEQWRLECGDQKEMYRASYRGSLYE